MTYLNNDDLEPINLDDFFPDEDDNLEPEDDGDDYTLDFSDGATEDDMFALLDSLCDDDGDA